MNKLKIMNAKEIIDLLESKLFRDNDHEPDYWMCNDVFTDIKDVEEHYTDKDDEFVEAFRTLGEIESVDSYGGEGKGDDYWRVFHFKTHNVYLEFYGWYASHSGPEYEGVHEVQPVEVMKIEWKEVK